MTMMPRLVSPMVNKPETVREGRGFSVSEVQAAGLTPSEARILGVPVDPRRKSSLEENVDTLKTYVTQAKEAKVKVPRPRQSAKGQRGRADRSLTKAGKTSRGLVRGRGPREV